jgi:hypothetical protein
LAVQRTQVWSVLQVGVPGSQAGLAPVVPSLAETMQATQDGAVSPVQTGVPGGQAAFLVSLPLADGAQATQASLRQAGVGVVQRAFRPPAFSLSRQAEQACVAVSHTGVAPAQSLGPVQPPQVPLAPQDGCAGSLQSLLALHCAQYERPPEVWQNGLAASVQSAALEQPVAQLPSGRQTLPAVHDELPLQAWQVWLATSQCGSAESVQSALPRQPLITPQQLLSQPCPVGHCASLVQLCCVEAQEPGATHSLAWQTNPLWHWLLEVQCWMEEPPPQAAARKSAARAARRRTSEVMKVLPVCI